MAAEPREKAGQAMNRDRRAAVVGFTEWAPQRKWPEPMFTLEAFARLSKEALEDAGMELGEVDGILTTSPVPESRMFAPSAVAEYLGIPSSYGEIVDLGGASGAGMLWRAVQAIESVRADAALCCAELIACPGPDGRCVCIEPEPGGAASSSSHLRS
ncbi:MAG: hypothetical protein U5Q44_00435 [Dehalococcoidia bacterium]|nr:hypothetical protein [Dehalococcoidia bacterium]